MFGTPIAFCLHQAKRYTLVPDNVLSVVDHATWIRVDVFCCPKCARKRSPKSTPVCWGCGATPDEFTTRGQLGLRDVNGRAHCKRCRATGHIYGSF